MQRINTELAKPCAKPSQVQYDSRKGSGKGFGKIGETFSCRVKSSSIRFGKKIRKISIKL